MSIITSRAAMGVDLMHLRVPNRANSWTPDIIALADAILVIFLLLAIHEIIENIQNFGASHLRTNSGTKFKENEKKLQSDKFVFTTPPKVAPLTALLTHFLQKTPQVKVNLENRVNELTIESKIMRKQ
uniref:Uncharacterized protein n=1 Tax=Megaselia scalaris TaxID=36166 RepID=T1GH66_MEGSC